MEKHQAFILLALVKPTEEIIQELQALGYSDKDVPWLNAKLNSFAIAATAMLGKDKHISPSQIANDAPMNDENREKYIMYFSTFSRFFRYHMEN